jgi:hypothetical protein
MYYVRGFAHHSLRTAAFLRVHFVLGYEFFE